MRRSRSILVWWSLALALAGWQSASPSDAAAAPATFQVQSSVSVADVRRVGVNLGMWTSWGAEQLAANVLKNPGFEGTIDRVVVIVKHAGASSFTDDTPWLARPDGFWAGARYDIRTGRSAGRRGTVLNSSRSGPNGPAEFRISDGDPVPAPGDVVVVTRIHDDELPAMWWVPDRSRSRVSVDASERRPGSPGVRALVLAPDAQQPVEVASYLDAIGDRAGKLLPVVGTWRLSFWSRRRGDGVTLSVVFSRSGSPPFATRTFVPADRWARTTLEWRAEDAGPPGTLALSFRASGAGGAVLLDDVELGPADVNAGAFRREVAAALNALRPGYLRDWQGQLGDTLDNRLAPAFARRATRTRPGGEGSTEFGYSLPEFLELCRSAGADPWIILPPAFSDDELVGLGRFLGTDAVAAGFREILVEFGNENWNPLFRSGGIPDPRAHGEAGQRAFALLRQGAGKARRVVAVVNGQHANPAHALRFLEGAPAADVLAVAPYFLPSLAAGTSPPDMLAALFKGDDGRLRALAEAAGAASRELAVYEVNLHTVGGDAPAAERDPATAGAAAGTALARNLLDAVALGVRRQSVYALAGYDAFTQDRKGFARLWGIARDLGSTRRLRPTGLAVLMLNRVIGGSLHHVSADSDARASGVTVAAFHSSAGWSAALVSASSEPREVVVAFPQAPVAPVPRHLLRLAAPHARATNEEREDVRVVEERLVLDGSRVRLRIEPWGLVVLPPAGGAS